VDVVTRPAVLYDVRLELPPPERIDGGLTEVLLENARARKQRRLRRALRMAAIAVALIAAGVLIGWVTWKALP
jgi:hypothetical protein